MTSEPLAFTPDWVSPPGDTICDLLEERDWTKVELATRLGCTVKHVHGPLKGSATMGPDTAERLALVLGSTSQFWLKREARYRAALQRQVARERAAASAPWRAELP